MDPDGHARRVLEFDKVTESLATRTRTEGGQRLVQALVPATESATVQLLQARTQELRALLDAAAAPPSLTAVADYRLALQQCQHGDATLAALELRALADTLETAARLRRWLREHVDQLPEVTRYLGELPDCIELVRSIHKAILESGEIDDAASARLRDVRTRQVQARKRLVQRLDKMVADQPADSDSWVTLRGERYVIPVRADAAGSVPGIVHDRSASGVTLFVEPLEIVDANNELQGLHDAELRECQRILQELTAAVLQQQEASLQSLVALERLDALLAMAEWSRQLQAATPALGDAIHLMQARHPLLALQMQASGDNIVPLDIELQAGQSLVITGPNAGGKTVALKCLGLLVLMHQSGLQISAHADSQLPIVKRLVADIGDEQSIEAAQSTFSSHLFHIGRAVQQAAPGSLILLDEFMSGTDPQEGAALAKVILRRFVQMRSQALVTTHLGELKLFAHAEPGVANAAMMFDPESRAPLYRLQAGIPGSSNALTIASRMGLPDELLQQAQELRGSDSGRLEEAIAAMEQERQRLAVARQQAEAAERDSSRLREEHATELKKLLGQRKQHLAGARQEAAELVRAAKAQIENLVRELRETAASRETIRKAHQSLESLDSELQDIPPTPEVSGEEPQVGDEVFLAGLQRQAQVVEVDRQGKLRVRFGNVEMRVDAAEVEVRRRPSAGKSPPAGPGKKSPGRQGGHRPLDRSAGGHDIQAEEIAALRLDVRGLDREEALAALDRFLDRAVLHGAPLAQIIHGKGTGVLRASIQAFLAEHPRVASHRLGEHGEGGSGVTIVNLD